jgi:hypothetical protein
MLHEPEGNWGGNRQALFQQQLLAQQTMADLFHVFSI